MNTNSSNINQRAGLSVDACRSLSTLCVYSMTWERNLFNAASHASGLRTESERRGWKWQHQRSVVMMMVRRRRMWEMLAFAVRLWIHLLEGSLKPASNIRVADLKIHCLRWTAGENTPSSSSPSCPFVCQSSPLIRHIRDPRSDPASDINLGAGALFTFHPRLLTADVCTPRLASFCHLICGRGHS